MARKIEIELTSKRDDGTWTWRAAGAREPRGTADGDVVPAGATVGDVLRAEAEFDIEGIVVTSAVTTRTAAAEKGRSTRIEIIGSGREAAPGVSVSLASGKRPRREEGDDGARRRAPGAGRRDRAGGPEANVGRAGAGERPGRAATTGRGERPDRPERPARSTRGERGQRPDRPARPDRAERPERPDRAGRGERGRRFQTVSTYRNAMLAELRPEQLPVAEQLLRGGVPAVRQAIDEQNTRARAEGRGEVAAPPLLAMAEELLARVNLATWKDRATAVRNAGGDAPLRELRSVVAGASTVSLDDEGRAMAGELRTSLDARVKAMLESWLGSITNALDDDRVLDALRASARPPDRTARVPAEMAVRLSAAAGQAMVPELDDATWSALLEAVIDSPVRRTVKPVGLPAAPGEELLAAVRRAAGAVPELARLLGLPIPPPPGPRRTGGPDALAVRRP